LLTNEWVVMKKKESAGSYVIIQTHVPFYRIALFSALYEKMGRSFSVRSGSEHFTPTKGMPAAAYPWHISVRNRFMLSRRLSWQNGVVPAAVEAEICVLELNPRILSNWWIAILRRLKGRNTVLWGHVFPRAGERKVTRLLRFAMFAIARSANVYTYAEGKALSRLFPGVRVNISPNAVMWKKECYIATELGVERKRILFIARMIEEKKPVLLLEAFAVALPNLCKDIVLDFVGDGPLLAKIKARVDELGLVDRVRVHGEEYDTEKLRTLYAEAIVAVCPGYMGLSATQSFGFGVPMLVARDEPHSVEITLCRQGFNCLYFESNSPAALAAALVEFVQTPHGLNENRERICEEVRRSYTYDYMCDGFLRLSRGAEAENIPVSSDCHIAIAWKGLPYYAARAVKEATLAHPEWRFTIISSKDNVPYKGIEEIVGQKVHWIDSTKIVSWRELGEEAPDLMFTTSWNNRAYQALAREAKRSKGTHIVSMVDNYLRYTLKQILGFFYFRWTLRDLYSAMWVPGEYSRKFMRFLGVPEEDIYLGLYTADNDLFRAPERSAERSGIVFVGQLIERKGLRNLVAAIKMDPSLLEAGIEIIGDGRLQQDLLDAGCTVHPFMQPHELSGLYRKATALILPSEMDHWGVVVHEAALSGCILLVTRHCGSSFELVKHRSNGYVMSEASPEEIRKAIIWLRNLSALEIESGRNESIRRGQTISLAGWVDTLNEHVERFVRERECKREGAMLRQR
jgi:glycosyltransferase involved in cell wall biosynthesis